MQIYAFIRTGAREALNGRKADSTGAGR